MSETITTIDVQGKLPKVASGKVRDLFAVDDDTLLFVASDRISAYDVIMENVSIDSKDLEINLDYQSRLFFFENILMITQGIPGKGALLTAMRYNSPHQANHQSQALTKQNTASIGSTIFPNTFPASKPTTSATPSPAPSPP